MKKLILPLITTILLVLGAIPASAQTASTVDNPVGWTNAKWGMSIDEIRTSFDGKLVEVGTPETVTISGSKAECRLRLADVNISGHQYVASFFTKSGKLVGVRLEPTTLQTEDELQARYASLDSGLVSKYGKPTIGRTANFDLAGWSDKLDESRKVSEAMRVLRVSGRPRISEEMWQFPNTTIYLGAGDHQGPNGRQFLNLVLVYVSVQTGNL